MTFEFWLVMVALIVGLVVVLFLLRKWIQNSARSTIDSTTLIEWLKSMQSSLESTNKALGDAMRGTSVDVAKLVQENTRQLNERLDSAAQVMNGLQRSLGEMSEVGRGIKTLQQFLQSPKLRGNIGEQVLKDMIGEAFPKNAFHLQYSFKSGVKVDAVLKTEAGLLCIDSKFPMENFESMIKGESELSRTQSKRAFIADVKKHISDISKKYILPQEHTLDFALMYIPSESVYYEVANSPEITDFARRNRVYPVSPNTLYAHLQVLLLSFQGKELETKSHQIFQLLRAIQKDYGKVEENISILNRHITNAHNQMDNVTQSFGLIGQKLSQTQTIDPDAQEAKQLPN